MESAVCGLSTGGAGGTGATLAAALQFFAASQCLLQAPWPQHYEPRNGSCYDFVVVGAGTAGSLLAARLAESPQTRVLLIEAGPNPPQESIIPGFRQTLKNSRFDWNFTTVNDSWASQALYHGRQNQPRGRMLGGTGSFNDMVYARGFPVDYNEWSEILNDKVWSWENVLEYFKRTEHMTDESIVDDPELMKYHNQGGEIEVSGPKESTYDTDKFLDAFVELGFKRVKDMTNPDQKFGAGRFSHTIRDGMRDSTVISLLNKAAKKRNLKVLRDAYVTKILIENSTVYGVEVQLEDDSLMRFYASKEVIVSAGTFNTPKLLQLSGIGPKNLLDKHGIEVVADLPVGKNLHDHVMAINYLAAKNGTCYTDPATRHMNLIQYLYDHSGPLSINNGMGAYFNPSFINTPTVPNFAYYPVCIPVDSGFYTGCVEVLGLKPSICSKLDKVNQDYELFSIAAVLLKPSSRGEVKISSTDPREAPLIFSGTFSNEDDLKGYPEVMEVVRNMTQTSYFKTVDAQVVHLDIDVCEGLEGTMMDMCRARATAMSAWHAGGTCSMGSVLDSRLRVVGVQSLRVVDASVMPKPVRGNTNAPVVMIAEKASDFIKKEYKL